MALCSRTARFRGRPSEPLMFPRPNVCPTNIVRPLAAQLMIDTSVNQLCKIWPSADWPIFALRDKPRNVSPDSLVNSYQLTPVLNCPPTHTNASFYHQCVVHFVKETFSFLQYRIPDFGHRLQHNPSVRKSHLGELCRVCVHGFLKCFLKIDNRNTQ